MLTISELNQVIKHYAYQVQQRIDDLDRLTCPTSSQDEAAEPELLSIISKYHNYISKEQKQTKLAQKLVERILQIFDFFKSKSKNQNLLTMIQQRIQIELNAIVNSNSVNLGEMFSYIRMIAKPGGIIKVPAQKRRIFSKSIIRQSIKNQPKISPTQSLFNIQRRGTSLITPGKHVKTQTLAGEKWRMDQILNGIWNCLEVERIHLVRVKEGNQQHSVKQMLRRNDKTLQAMKQFEKRWRFGVTEGTEQDRTILSQMKSNVRNVWTSKRKRVGCVRRQNTTLKENVSIVL